MTKRALRPYLCFASSTCTCIRAQQQQHCTTNPGTMSRSAKRVLAAFDKFKDSITAADVGAVSIQSLASALSASNSSVRVDPEQCRVIPMSDGGEGFLNGLVFGNPDARVIETDCISSNGTSTLRTKWGIIHQSDTNTDVAVLEMALIAGFEITPVSERNPLNLTTYGIGQVLRQALDEYHVRKVIMGVGGSSTNDGGLGALQALGVRFSVGDVSPFTEPIRGRDLTAVRSFNTTDIEELITNVEFEVACDVNNPFIGPSGAVHVFAKQKGANEQDRAELERGMVNVNEVFKKQLQIDLSQVAGAGAAGGIAGGFHAILGAKLRRGVDIIATQLGLEEAIQQADVVFTGEGSYDEQTQGGKVISKVRELAFKHNKPVVIICGVNKTGSAVTKDQYGEARVFDLVSGFPLDKCMKEAGSCVQATVARELQPNGGLYDLFLS